MSACQSLRSLGFSRQEQWSGLPFLSQCMKVKSESEVAQSCLTLSDPMACSLPGFSVHGIFQARVLVWGAIAFSEWRPSAAKIKKKKKFSQRNQWGLRGRRTCKMMKPVWVWYHASHGEVSHSLFSQGAWDIVPQTCPSPRLGSWDFTLPLAHPSHPSTNTQLVSPSPCSRSSNYKSKVTLEAKDTKAQENATSDNV